MAKKNKFYVVWQGRKPGIYSSWEACKSQVQAFESARYMGFETQEQAERAFKEGWKTHYALKSKGSNPRPKPRPTGEALPDAAAGRGNPGRMEYGRV